jgi:hypothetical protein
MVYVRCVTLTALLQYTASFVLCSAAPAMLSLLRLIAALTCCPNRLQVDSHARDARLASLQSHTAAQA